MRKIKNWLKNEGKNFKNFALKDNAISLAVGVIIGVAFKDLVDALVKYIFTPPIGYLTAKIDFSNLFIALGKTKYDTLAEAISDNAVVLQYGLVINSLITFLLTAIVLYLIVRAISKATEKKEEAKAKKNKVCPYCLSEIPIKAKKCAYCTSTIK
ncbi:MAG: large conductance mechanosensitive channel protein MscL [Candidatus Dojkabacteria bacterium]